MPALTIQQITDTITSAAQAAIQKYGIRDAEAFIQTLIGIAQIESGWVADAPGDKQPSGRYASYGLFQLLDYTDDGRRGRGYGMSVEDRTDPQKNAAKAADYLGAIWADGEKKNQMPGDIAERLIREGQVPADPESAIQRLRQVERESMGAYEARGQAVGARVSLGEWLEQQGYAAPFPEDWAQPAGSAGIEWFNGLPAAMKESIYNQWSTETGRGAEAGITPLEREETEARTAVNWANAQEIIARLGGTRYEDERNRILDKIDQENWTAEQAISEFNAWMTGALEAGKRAETVYGEKMKRAAWTTPTEYFPGTEPGGARGQFAEKYGVPYTSSPGIATETLPNLDEMYGQWHGRMGISEQAPPTQGGWSGQGAPMGRGGAPQGGNASQAFLSQLRQRYAGQFGAGRA